MNTKTYDSKCYELAQHFLDEHKQKPVFHALCHQLAIEVQKTVEDYCEELDIYGSDLASPSQR